MENLFINEEGFTFIGELLLRTAIMFIAVVIVLRLSGRRGVRQLSLFEVAIILTMGSAAGDPTFQQDIPILYGVAVLLAIILLYKVFTFLASKINWFHNILEGTEMPVVKDGMFDIKNNFDNDFSQQEFFTELRNMSVEHLGQVREAIIEPDGSLSVLFFKNEEVRYGLPLFPSSYISIDPQQSNGPFACMFCGYTTDKIEKNCPRCNKTKWTHAINTHRIA